MNTQTMMRATLERNRNDTFEIDDDGRWTVFLMKHEKKKNHFCDIFFKKPERIVSVVVKQ